MFRVFKFHTVQDLNTLLIEDYSNHTFEDWIEFMDLVYCLILETMWSNIHIVSKVSKIFYFLAVFFNSLLFSMRMTEKTSCVQSRQVRLNKTLADIRKIVGFKKLTEQPVKIDFYILKGLRFLCDYYYSNWASLENDFLRLWDVLFGSSIKPINRCP